jgi:hypothetical protein
MQRKEAVHIITWHCLEFNKSLFDFSHFMAKIGWPSSQLQMPQWPQWPRSLEYSETYQMPILANLFIVHRAGVATGAPEKCSKSFPDFGI